MAFFTWGPSFEVGIAQIDEQHKKLVSLVNQLYEAMSQGRGSDVLGKILTELTNYTVEHFKTEEKLMQGYGYPGFSEHKAKHDSMTKKVLDLKREFDSGKGSVLTNSVAQFLKDWLQKHIQGTDKQYAPHLKQKGVS